jgi:hypothetical protein
VNIAQTYVQVTNVKTPKGSTVQDVYSLTSSDATYSSSQLAAIAADLSDNYNGAELIDAPSYKYNCHGYAWHISEGGNKVWIGKETVTAEDIYWTDGSYIEVTESEATKVSYHQSGNHSAIRLNSTWYQSKWGANVLVKHHPNDVPPSYQPSMTKKYYKLQPPTISGPDNPYSFQQITYTINNLPAGTTVTWSGSSNVSMISGQGTSQVTISICGAHLATLTATLTGTIDTILSKEFLINNGNLTVVPQVGYINVEFSHPYAQCYDWNIYNFISEKGSGTIICDSSGILTLEPPYGVEGESIQVRAQSNGCYTPWLVQNVHTWHPEIDSFNSYLNPMTAEPFWVNLVEPAPDDGKTGSIQYYWYFGDTLFEITDEPYIHSYTWPCGDYNLSVVVHIDDYEASTTTDFWGMCIHRSSSTALADYK